MIALLARVDERPFKYSDSDSNELLDRDRERVDALNAIAGRVSVPRVSPLPAPLVEANDPATSSNRHRRSRSVTHLPDRAAMMFQSACGRHRPGNSGLAGPAVRRNTPGLVCATVCEHSGLPNH